MEPKQIIIHHSLTKDGRTVSWNAIREYHISHNHFYTIGYHYGIELINSHYEILVGRTMDKQGAHTKNHNYESLGICFVGNFDIEDVPLEQWKLGIDLVKSLCNILNIKIVKGHNEYTGYKTCPGKRFDMNQFRNDLLI